MSEIQVRIPRGIGQRLFEELSLAAGREPVVFGFATHASSADREIICLRRIEVPPDGAFLPSLGHGARWSGKYMIELLNEAMASRSGLFIFHSHPGQAVRMSLDDVNSAKQLLLKFQLIAPSRPHGSLVFGTSSAAGLILMPDQDELISRFAVRLFADRMIDWPLPEASPTELLRFERQPLVKGPVLDKILKQTKIVVVGQSGGGTHASLQLAQQGFGEVCGIDDDSVDDGNRFSGIGFSEQDAAERRKKIEVLRKLISRVARSVRYVPLNARVPEQASIDALKRADIIVGCVNNLHARADLQEIALRYAIPYFDIGLTLKPEADSPEEFLPIAAISGNVFTYVPGEACMWCTGFLSEDKLAAETDGRGRPYLQTKDGADARVLSFNGVLASQAVNDILSLITGFSAAPPISYRKYDGFKGTLLPCLVKRVESCEKCANYLAAGDPIWIPVARSAPSRSPDPSLNRSARSSPLKRLARSVLTF